MALLEDVFKGNVLTVAAIGLGALLLRHNRPSAAAGGHSRHKAVCWRTKGSRNSAR